jgi:hypothetical protein
MSRGYEASHYAFTSKFFRLHLVQVMSFREGKPLGWGLMSAQNASVVTNVVTSVVEINKRGECYAFFWLHCRQKPTHRILQLCGVLSKVLSLQRTHFVRSCRRCLRNSVGVTTSNERERRVRGSVEGCTVRIMTWKRSTHKKKTTDMNDSTTTTNKILCETTYDYFTHESCSNYCVT